MTRSVASSDSSPLPHPKAGQPFRLLVELFDAVDLCSARPLVGEADKPLNGILVAFEHGLDGAVPAVRDPARHTVLVREPTRRVAEEDALHATVDDDTTSNHGRILRAMEFQDVLRRRRSVRAYSEEAVPRELLERIVATIRRVPSAGFSQGQRLVVVSEAARKRALADAVGEEYYVEQGFEPWISGAAAVVVVCTREQDYHERYQQPDKLDEEGAEIVWPVPYWHVDAGKAAMVVILAAIDEGLATAIFGFPSERLGRVRELLSLPNDVTPVEAITIGHAGDDTVSDAKSSRGTRPRKPLGELVHWERW
jgi:nitroreductase